MQLSDKHKQLLKWAGYPLLALMTFVFAAHCTFPYERVKDRFFVEPLSEKYDVTVLEVDRSFWPGGMILRSVALRTRPSQPDEQPTTLFFDEIRLDLGLMAMLRGRVDVDIEAAIGGGTIEGNVQASRAEVKASFSTSGLPLGSLPGVREAVGLPMKGGLHADIALTLPEGRWDRAEGKVSLACPGCTIGDGVSKIKPRARPGRRISARMAAFAGDGMTVPELNLGDLSATVNISGGRGVIEDFQATSPDGELALQAVVRFGRRFKDSSFESGCMKFKLSEELKKREPNFGNLPQFMRMSPQADGFSNVKLQGKLITMRWRPTQSCEAGGDDDDDRVSKRGSRPSIPARRPELDRPEINRPEPAAETEPPRPRGENEPMTLNPPSPLGDGRRDGVNIPDTRTSGPPIAPDRPVREGDVKPDEPPHKEDDVRPVGIVPVDEAPDDDGREVRRDDEDRDDVGGELEEDERRDDDRRDMDDEGYDER